MESTEKEVGKQARRDKRALYFLNLRYDTMVSV
jgi:hypothetical protein